MAGGRLYLLPAFLYLDDDKKRWLIRFLYIINEKGVHKYSLLVILILEL
jgi:hypothetical protein